MTSESPPPSSSSVSRNTILMGLGAALVVIVPSSINAIESPVMRAAFALGGLVIVFVLGYYTLPHKKK